MSFQSANHKKILPIKGHRLLRQVYKKDPLPKGVVIVSQKVFYDDQGGYFKENYRQNTAGYILELKEQGIDFRTIQTSTSVFAPRAERFWHVHPNQNEYLTSNGTLLIGLVDLRPNSVTYGLQTKVILSIDRGLFVPSGVAHGYINPNATDKVTLTYSSDTHFTADDKTEEYRIDPEELSYDFVKPEVM